MQPGRVDAAAKESMEESIYNWVDENPPSPVEIQYPTLISILTNNLKEQQASKWYKGGKRLAKIMKSYDTFHNCNLKLHQNYSITKTINRLRTGFCNLPS